MSTKQQFAGKIENKRIRLYNRESFDLAVEKLNEHQVTITLESGLKRSNAQNAYYFGVVIKELVKATGDDPDNIHQYLKTKFNPKNLKIVSTQTGEIDEAVIGGSTTQLTTIEFGEYIDAILRWAAQFLNLVIPEPNQTEWTE